MMAVPTCVLAALGTKTSLAGAPTVTLRVAVALVNPAALTVILAVPIVIGVRLDVAMPALAVTGDAGLKEPETPLTVNVTASLAVPTVWPSAS